jgi:hypothetical protein
MLGSSVTVTSRALFYSGDSDRLVPARTRRTKFSPPTLPQWLILGGFALAGPFLALMGRFNLLPGLAISVAFILVGVWLAWLFPRLQPVGRMTAGMFAVGGIAMLAGWWADAGFGPVIRDGVCLCGCPKSVLGWGMISKITGMQLAMVFASLPVALWFGPVLPERSRRLKHWMIGLLGMVAGMEAAGFAMAQIPTIQPQLHFVLSFVAMMLGMTGGMLVCCGTLARLAIRPRPSSSSSTNWDFARLLAPRSFRGGSRIQQDQTSNSTRTGSTRTRTKDEDESLSSRSPCRGRTP